MTAILVTQVNVGASLGLAVDRLLGSLLGVIVGGAVALAVADHQEWKIPGWPRRCSCSLTFPRAGRPCASPA